MQPVASLRVRTGAEGSSLGITRNTRRIVAKKPSRKLVGFEGIQEGRSYCLLAFFHLSSSSSIKPDVTSL
jgi:hypothetical protein